MVSDVGYFPMATYLVGFKLSATVVLYMLMVQLSIALVRSRRNTGNDISDAEELRNRYEELQNWKCDTPKPRLVYVLDEYRNLETTNAVWMPNAAVLHRCDNALGCCLGYPTKTCQPRAYQNVSIVFQRINAITGTSQHERLRFTNHTSCGCA